ncbi:hypothetical protein JW710_01605 [Candidatus Dojkabacteria bacterium]|nr:hypothetical protein [Candidatus Dojkabacteria bacterium]
MDGDVSLEKNEEESEQLSTVKRDVNLVPEFSELLGYYNRVREFESKDTVSPIHVDELASRVAVVYEKIRQIIDWKDEHLIRRMAIERSLKRSMISKISGIDVLPGATGENLAEPLVMEIIRGGHLPNDKIPKTKIAHVTAALNKYIYILNNNNVGPLAVKTRVNFYNWILEVAACEIEEILSPPLKENGMMNFMTNMINKRLKLLPDNYVSAEDRVILTYIAVQRTLYNLDDPIISYNILKYKYPKWISDPNSLIREIAANSVGVWKEIEDYLSDKRGAEFYKVCEKYDAAYLVLGDALSYISSEKLHFEDVCSDWERLRDVIRKAYDERLSTLKSRLTRSAIYSTLSIFLAGGLSLFVFEVPLAALFYGHFSPIAVVVDIMIPTVLMFLLVITIRPTRKDNFERVLEEIRKIIYVTDDLDTYEVQFNKKGKTFINLLFGFSYFIVTVVSFGLVFYLFYIAKVPWTSLYVDTANIAIIVFAALVIRQKAKEVTIEENAGAADFLIDIFSIPLAKLGQWLASKWKEYNIFSVFFTVVVDYPIMTIVGLIEDWRNFLKDKKSAIH